MRPSWDGQFRETEDERNARLRAKRDQRERERAQGNGIPIPTEGSEGLPIPASQDPLRRPY